MNNKTKKQNQESDNNTNYQVGKSGTGNTSSYQAIMFVYFLVTLIMSYHFGDGTNSLFP